MFEPDLLLKTSSSKYFVTIFDCLAGPSNINCELERHARGSEETRETSATEACSLFHENEKCPGLRFGRVRIWKSVISTETTFMCRYTSNVYIYLK